MAHVILGVLGLLAGLRLLTSGVQGAGSHRLRRLLAAATGNPWRGLVAGCLAAALLHSSSAAAMLVEGLVRAGALSLREGAVLLMGANVGTTATAHLLAMGGIPPWPLAVSGALLWWRSRRPVVRGIAQALLGTGLLLAGLDALGTGLAPLGAAPRFDGALAVVRGEPWLGFAAGAALTAAAFSSTAAVGVLQSLAVQGILTVPDALPFLWGLNVGTTADALAVGWWLGGPALSAAFFHAAFNLVGAAAFMPLNGLLAAVLARCVPDPAAQLAWAHTVQNAGTALLCLPALEPLVRLCDGLANLRPGRRRA